MRFTLFFLTALGVLSMVAFALLSAKVRAFWQRVRQGFTILRDRRTLLPRDVHLAGGELGRAVRLLLGAARRFPHRRSVRNALLVLAVQVVASVFPFTPGGLGVQQALLLQIFAGSAYVAAFSVGQQIATTVLTCLLGFAALILIFRFKSFREVIARGREHRRNEAAVTG